jgi:hypothetical protein
VDYEARNCLEKVCIVLNPSIMCGGLTKSYDVIHDNLSNLSNQPTTLVTKNEFKLYDINIDLGLIKSWVDEQTEAIQKEFLKKIPQSTFTASHLQISRVSVSFYLPKGMARMATWSIPRILAVLDCTDLAKIRTTFWLKSTGNFHFSSLLKQRFVFRN